MELPVVADPNGLCSALGTLGVNGAVRGEPEPVDIAGLRSLVGLTQREFAIRFGFELATLRNWEQNRCPQDHQTRVLPHIIRRHPELVDDVLASAGTTP